jgi:electron transport complex protein RnfA
MAEFIAIVIGAILVKNFVLAQFLGLCPFIGVSKKTETALGMGMAVTFVMTLAAIVTWLIHFLFLVPTEYNLIYQVVHIFDKTAVPASFNFVLILRTLTFILVIATLVQFVEMFMKKASPALYDALGIYLPLITTNCAVLGVAVINSRLFFGKEGVGAPVSFSFLKATVHGFAAGLGFTLAMLLMSGIRERLEDSAIPEPLKGVPIAFICTSFMALAFGGFTGLI